MTPLSIGLALLGAVAAGVLGSEIGIILGIVTGYLAGEIFHLKKRLAVLESKILDQVEIPSEKLTENSKATPSSQPVPVLSEDLADDRIFDPPGANEPDQVNETTQTDSSKNITSNAGFSQNGKPVDAAPSQKLSPSFWQRFFKGGNLMVRMGLIVLFFGIAFLVKYAAEQNLFPIELRLAACALFAIILTVVGWFLQNRRRGYALSLQGGGVGILYLTIFGAAKLYYLLPLIMAFGLMTAIVIASTLLALLQNSRSLAILGSIGGFLAPVLTSSNTGNHVMLFSYYLLLNGGILTIAWFKAWRELNLLGFIFTFGIGTAWGVSTYSKTYLTTTEPFLIVFFLIYFSLSILFALRQPVNLKGYVDSTLVFGLPLATFGLQSGLVGHMQFGLAISALTLAALYILSATTLWYVYKDTLKLLVEAFLALGVMFATLAVPLATNGHWTTGTWALEGAALFWIGVRQTRLLSRISGLLLQLGAALAVLILLLESAQNAVISGFILAAAGLLISYLIYTDPSKLKKWECRLAPFLLAWGVIWWMGTGLHEISLRFAVPRESQVSIVFVAASLVFFNRAGIKVKWPQLRYLGLGLLPLMLILALYAFEHRIKADPFRQGGWVVWLLNFVGFYDILKTNQGFWPVKLSKIYHVTGALLLLFFCTWDLSYWTDFLIGTTETWPLTIWGLVPGLAALALLYIRNRACWPVSYDLMLYRHKTVAVVLVYLLLWCLVGFLEKGDPAPLSYVPILNPIDLVTLFILLLIFTWNHHFYHQPFLYGWEIPKGIKVALIGIYGCIWLSAVVIRTAHFWGQIPYNAPTMATSSLVQACLSVLWSLYAMTVLLLSTKKGSREGWIAGAGLLAIVVIKLFLIDLAGTGTIARIVSFVAVGILMLIIGYFSPLPPSIRKEDVI